MGVSCALGVGGEGGLAGAGAVRPLYGDVDGYLESGGCSADVVRDAGFSLPVGAAVVLPINRAIVSYGRNSDICDRFDIDDDRRVIGGVRIAH